MRSPVPGHFRCYSGIGPVTRVHFRTLVQAEEHSINGVKKRDLVASGKVSLAPLVTGRYPLESVVDAFEFASTRKAECVKIVIQVAG